MSGKYALIIGNSEYTDPGLAQLTAPGKDAEDFAHVLKSKDICAFDDVNVLLNEPSFVVSEAIDAFFYQKKPDDLLIVYFSGHGVRDEFGILYLAVKNTNRARLRATAIRSDYIREAMDQSRSKRQVIVLDCCNSGAFSQGTKAEVGGMMGMVSALQGYGRFVLTASDATQFAWEGDRVIGETDNSLFTHFLVKGLEGEADRDSDGKITVDELYDYAYDQISKVTPKQTPTKSASKVEGEIVLRQFARLEDIKPVALPDDLISEIEDLRPSVREWAVQRLEKILKGKNIGMARSAKEALEKIATEDDSRRVSQAATQILDFIRQEEKKAEEERRAREEAERLAALKAEEERKAQEEAERLAEERRQAEKQAEEERKAKEEAEGLAALKAEEARKAQEEAERLAKQKRRTEEKVEKDRKAKEEAERLAVLKAEEERLVREKAETERKAQEERLVKQKAELENANGQIQIKQELSSSPEFLRKLRLNWMKITGSLLIPFGLLIILQVLGIIGNVDSYVLPFVLIWLGLIIICYTDIETQKKSQLAEFGRAIHFPRWGSVIIVGLIATIPFYSLLNELARSPYAFWSLIVPLTCGGLVTRISRNKSGSKGMSRLVVGGISGIPCLFAFIVWIWTSGFSFAFDSSVIIFGALILISAGVGGGLVDHFDSRIQPS